MAWSYSFVNINFSYSLVILASVLIKYLIKSTNSIGLSALRLAAPVIFKINNIQLVEYLYIQQNCHWLWPLLSNKIIRNYSSFCRFFFAFMFIIGWYQYVLPQLPEVGVFGPVVCNVTALEAMEVHATRRTKTNSTCFFTSLHTLLVCVEAILVSTAAAEPEADAVLAGGVVVPLQDKFTTRPFFFRKLTNVHGHQRRWTEEMESTNELKNENSYGFRKHRNTLQ